MPAFTSVIEYIDPIGERKDLQVTTIQYYKFPSGSVTWNAWVFSLCSGGVY